MSDFNPDEHTVAEVLEHLEASDVDEQVRVMDAEAGGKDRAGIRNFGDTPEVEAPKVKANDTEGEMDFDQTSENATFLLAAAASLGLSPSVVTTKDGRLQAPTAVVKAAGNDLSTDKD